MGIHKTHKGKSENITYAIIFLIAIPLLFVNAILAISVFMAIMAISAIWNKTRKRFAPRAGGKNVWKGKHQNKIGS
jgi:hypothetical protein